MKIDEKDKNGFYTKIHIDPFKNKLKIGQKLRIEGINYVIKNIDPLITDENGKRIQEIELSVLTGYLLCRKCNGYYKLKPGESQEDFTETCTCGGKLEYVINIDVVVGKEKHGNDFKKKKYQQNQKYHSTGAGGYEDNKPRDNTFTINKKSNLIDCPDCGHKISVKAKACPNCGRQTTYKDLPKSETKMTLGSFFIISFVSLICCFFVGLLLSLFFGTMTFIILLGGWFILSIFMLISYLNDRKR